MSEQFSLNEAIYNCRAMRRIKSDEVPEEVLLELIDLFLAEHRHGQWNILYRFVFTT